MPDYVVLKRLTLNSDLGWFRSVFQKHGLKTRQKAITLNKEVMNALWPSLLVRQNSYERHKAAQKTALAPGGAGQAASETEKAAAKVIGTIPVHVELHGPGGKPAILMERVIALQDKNWRLNGDFVDDPPGDPTRFYPVMQEGDLALIGFDDFGWPANPVVVLLSQSDDAALWTGLQARVARGTRSMVQVDQADLLAFANAQGLPLNHVIRTLATTSPVPAARLPFTAAAPVVRSPAPPRRPRHPPTPSKATPAQLAARLAKAALSGQLGEKVVDAYLATHGTLGQPVHTWVSQTFAEYPYDFELLSNTGAVHSVVDAKSTSRAWTVDFFMSAAEVAYAASSPVPYLIYRVSGVAPGAAAELRISDDLRPLAIAIENGSLATAEAGTQVTGVAIDPLAAGIVWTNPILLPPLPFPSAPLPTP